MNLLHLLASLGHSQQLGNNTPQARQYARNPRSFHGDPSQFGYPADNSGMHLGVQPQQFKANLGVPYGPVGQGGAYNPGYTPLQNSGFGPGGNPQMGAYQDQLGQLNTRPQHYRIQPGQEWLQ